MIGIVIASFFAIIGFGILVLVHEYGHFIMARINGVRVDTFSIGFGKPLIKYQGKETVYQIAAIPFGGFCKLTGDEADEERTGAQWEFLAKNPFQRILVVLGGSLFNYIFAILVFTIIFMAGRDIFTYSNKIEVIKELKTDSETIDSPAFVSGLKTGDIIKKIDGVEIRHWNEIHKKISFLPQKGIDFVVERNNKELEIKVKPIADSDTGWSKIGIIAFDREKPVIGKVIKKYPAKKSGLQEGDFIYSLDEKRIKTITEANKYIKERPGKDIVITVKRDGKLLKYNVTTREENKEGIIGVQWEPREKVHIPRQPFFTAFKSSIVKSYDVINQTLIGLGNIFKGKAKARKSLAGPVKIIYYIGLASQYGAVTFFEFLSMISILLAFFNLLPIPAVDGGFVIIFLIEGITGKAMNEKVLGTMTQIAFALLMGLIILVTINDLLPGIKSLIMTIIK